MKDYKTFNGLQVSQPLFNINM